MKHIKLFEEYNFSTTELEIINDILSVNEELGGILDKLKNYGKKGLLTLSIILALAGTVNATEATNVIETGVEYVDNVDKTDIYSALLSLSKGLLSEEMKGGADMDKVEGLKILSNYYLEKRDGHDVKLPENVKVFQLSVLKHMKSLDGKTIKQLTEDGKGIKSLP